VIFLEFTVFPRGGPFDYLPRAPRIYVTACRNSFTIFMMFIYVIQVLVLGI